MFIEVKGPGETLDDRAAQQLLDYAFAGGVPLAVLTNGVIWSLYLPLSEGPWTDRRFFTVDLRQQDPDVAAENLIRFLGRESVSSGDAKRSAEELRTSTARAAVVRRTLPLAWRELLGEPDELLVDLLKDRIARLAGHEADDATIKEFLQRMAETGMPTSNVGGSPVRAIDPPARLPISVKILGALRRSGDVVTGKKPSSFVFLGTRYQVSTWQEVLLKLGATIAADRPAAFERVLTLRGRKRVYFTRDPSQLTASKVVPGTDIYAEMNLSASDIMNRCSQILALTGYRDSDFTVDTH